MKYMHAVILFSYLVALGGCASKPTLDTVSDYNQLHVGTRLNLDSKITTVRQAVKWVLQPTDYRVSAKKPHERDILDEPLSPLAQTPTYMTIEEALLFIIGAENRLIVDHENKLISFEPVPVDVSGL